MTDWIRDNRGNKCSVEFSGSVESAQEALIALIEKPD